MGKIAKFETGNLSSHFRISFEIRDQSLVRTKVFLHHFCLWKVPKQKEVSACSTRLNSRTDTFYSSKQFGALKCESSKQFGSTITMKKIPVRLFMWKVFIVLSEGNFTTCCILIYISKRQNIRRLFISFQLLDASI